MKNARRILNAASSRVGNEERIDSLTYSDQFKLPEPPASSVNDLKKFQQQQLLVQSQQMQQLSMNMVPPWQNPLAMWNPWLSNPWMSSMSTMQLSGSTPQQTSLITAQQQVQTSTINRDNTTIIADIRLALMRSDDPAWTIQIAGNVTFEQCQCLIRSEVVTVKNKKYVFLSLGSNQVYDLKTQNVNQQIHRLVHVILDQNSTIKIFILPVLPRLFDNDYAKQYIVELNRVLSVAAKKMTKQNLAVKFLPIQNSFIVNGYPEEKSFEKDKLTLSASGCRKLKHLVFSAAGFKANV